VAPATREVAVGVIRRPFGLRGDVYVHPDPDLAEPFPPGRRYRTARPAVTQPSAPGPDPSVPDPSPADPSPADPDLPAELTVADSFVHRGLQVVRFEGVADREAASALRDAVLWRDADGDDIGADTWWTTDLLDRTVTDPEGNPLGTVVGVTDGPAHDYLVVSDPQEREVLVPLVADLVTITLDRITVSAPPGLFDPDDAAEAPRADQ
jgi:16S rRNA processing protein RimM